MRADEMFQQLARPDGRLRVPLLLLAVTLALRLPAAIFLNSRPELLERISRDSNFYDYMGKGIVDVTSEDPSWWLNSWSLWFDHGWKLIVGLCYLCWGPHRVVPALLATLFAGLAVLLTYRLAHTAVGEGRAAMLAALTFAVCPSFVYYSSIPLPEGFAVAGLMLVACGTVQMIDKPAPGNLLTIVPGLVMLGMVRSYLIVLSFVWIAVCLLLRVRGDHWKRAMPYLGAAAACFVVVAGILAFSRPYTDITAAEATDTGAAIHPFRLLRIDLLNVVRIRMNDGDGRLYAADDDARYGPHWGSNLGKAAKGMASFCLGVHLTGPRNWRQWLAIPEALLVVVLLPAFGYGAWRAWQANQQALLAVALLCGILAMAYGLVLTNIGAMYRFRIPVLPLYFVVVSYGVSQWSAGRRAEPV